MAITLEAIRAAGGIVHSDGNIFFRDISMLQGLAGAAPAAVAGPAKELAELELLNKLIKLGGEASYALAQSNSDDGRAGAEADDRWRKLRSEMGELIRAHKAPALEAPAAPVLVGDEQADAYLTDPGRLESLARSHPAGLVRALARAALAAAPQAPAAPMGEYTLVDEGGPVELAGAQAQYSIERADGSTAAWILGDGSAVAELMAALRMPVSDAAKAAPAAPAVDAQDAARMDYLRRNAEARFNLDYERVEISFVAPEGLTGFNTIDEAIDEAISAAQAKEGGAA